MAIQAGVDAANEKVADLQLAIENKIKSMSITKQDVAVNNSL
jgi:hypothetical protein